MSLFSSSDTFWMKDIRIVYSVEQECPYLHIEYESSMKPSRIRSFGSDSMASCKVFPSRGFDGDLPLGLFNNELPIGVTFRKVCSKLTPSTSPFLLFTLILLSGSYTISWLLLGLTRGRYLLESGRNAKRLVVFLGFIIVLLWKRHARRNSGATLAVSSNG
mgnify:FL=1|jgi:hypothetical protein